MPVLSMYVTGFVLLVAFAVAITLITAAVKILREYERAVVFTLGRFQKVKGPGLVLLFPFVQEMVRALAKPAEAERDRRAKIIHAEAEFQASQTLTNAARILSILEHAHKAPRANGEVRVARENLPLNA